MDLDAVGLLVEDHNAIKRLFVRHEASIEPSVKKDLFETIRQQLSMHDGVEEMRFWPEVRRVIPNGDELVDRRIQEEDKIKSVLFNLQFLEPGTHEYTALFGEFRDGVLAHAQSEEHLVFPKVRESYTPEELRVMAGELEMGKKMAPTHPHPEGPNKLPGLLLAGPPVAITDRLRDAASTLFAASKRGR